MGHDIDSRTATAVADESGDGLGYRLAEYRAGAKLLIG